MSLRKKIVLGCGCLIAVAVVACAVVGYRAYRVADVSVDAYSQVRYLIESGGTIGEAPASETLSSGYLEAVFGDNPTLFDQLQNVVNRGLTGNENVRLGEVAAMIVTYRTAPDGSVEDVVAHIVGDFPLNRRKPQMHRNGYFRHLIDKNLWNMGNTVLGYLGRDMLVFGEDHLVEEHEALLESIFAGDIMPLVNDLDRPLHYSVVFPDPRHIVPGGLRKHVQAVIVKGALTQTGGFFDTLIITPSLRSSAYAYSLFTDMKNLAQIALATKWRGVEEETAWGLHTENWWAHEILNNMDQAVFIQEENTIRLRSDFDRVGVNVVLKCLERMSRDVSQMRYSLNDKLDPRLADAKLQTLKPGHYWTEEHRWGPDWPIAAPQKPTD